MSCPSACPSADACCLGCRPIVADSPLQHALVLDLEEMLQESLVVHLMILSELHFQNIMMIALIDCACYMNPRVCGVYELYFGRWAGGTTLLSQ